MIALELRREGARPGNGPALAAALAAGTARRASHRSAGSWSAAQASLAAVHGDSWSPAGREGWFALFDGHLDNAAQLAAELGEPPPGTDRCAALYLAAWLRWGEGADRRITGHYAAVLCRPAAGRLVLVRSPFTAPPLGYCRLPDRLVAASVPRALFAAGLAPVLDETKLADHGCFNAAEEERGWFAGMRRVPLGGRAELDWSRAETVRWYDPRRLPPVHRRDPRDYVAEARALLDEGIAHAVRGRTRPGLLLSGGLDSGIVAGRLVSAVLPAGQPLHAYTATPEPDWDGFDYPDRFSDEAPLVRALTQSLPRIVPWFEDTAATGFDTALEPMFAAIGAAPIHLTNFALYQPLWQRAAQDGCDVLLWPEYGNFTISAEGEWALPGMLLRGRWRALREALHGDFGAQAGPVAAFRSLCVKPLVPRWLRDQRPARALLRARTPLREDFARRSGAAARARAAASAPERSLRQIVSAVMRQGHGESAEITHGLEQLHGIPLRDPTAYRPLVEFCLGLPGDALVRGGHSRWLARELGRGLLPDAVRLNRRSGRQGGDWRLKLGRRRAALLAELDQLEAHPRLAALYDFAKARAALRDWPQTSDLPHAARSLREVMVPRLIAQARFVLWAERLAAGRA